MKSNTWCFSSLVSCWKSTCRSWRAISCTLCVNLNKMEADSINFVFRFHCKGIRGFLSVANFNFVTIGSFSFGNVSCYQMLIRVRVEQCSGCKTEIFEIWFMCSIFSCEAFLVRVCVCVCVFRGEYVSPLFSSHQLGLIVTVVQSLLNIKFTFIKYLKLALFWSQACSKQYLERVFRIRRFL